MEQTVAASFASALRDLAVSKGADATDLERRSGISSTQFIDPDSRVPLDRYKALMRAGQELSGDPALALHFGEAADLAELSLVGLMGEVSDSFGDAFQALSRYSRLAIDVELEDGAEGRLTLKRSGGRLWMADTRSRPNDFPEITESAFARIMTVARRFGTLDLITAVHVTHSAPDYSSEYERIFPMPLVFNSRWNALQLRDDGWSTMRPRLPSRYMSELLRGRADALLNTLDVAATTRGHVEKALLAALPIGDVRMNRIASQLGISRPTLFRRLFDEGITFRQVVSELRRRLAADYLRQDRRSVGVTSQLLGFSDQASFSRAFKRWTGKSPRQFVREPSWTSRPATGSTSARRPDQ
ncbi:MAG: AraC family transcriptional regulator [Sphingomicrobium sp.]